MTVINTIPSTPPPPLTPAEDHHNMQVFVYDDGKDVRIVKDDAGDLWFNASDVCDNLGIENTSSAVSRLDGDEKGLAVFDTRGGPQRLLVVSEPGLYRLVASSTKQHAEKFTRWVYHFVLPSLRRTGAYVLTERPVTLQQMLRLAADEIDNSKREVKRIEQVVATKNAEIEEAAPKAAAYDRTVSTNAGTMSILEAGQILQTGQNRLMAFLREIGWVRVDRNTKHNVPYQEMIDRGYLVRKQGKRPVEQRNPKTGYEWTENVPYVVTMVTAKGLAELARLLDKAEQLRVVGRDD
jgi:anti-repressor protein